MSAKIRRPSPAIPWTVLTGLALLIGAPTPARSGPDPAEKPAPAELLGEPVMDLTGRRHVLGGVAGCEPIVFLFMGHECPISNRAVPRLNAIASIAREHRVQLFGVYSDATLARTAAVKHRREFAITFPQILDTGGRLATALGPKVVPEAIVLDRRGSIAYRGAINDAFLELARPRARIHKRFLVDAIKAVAANRAPKVREQAAVGCFLETAPDPVAASVSLRRHVRPILQARCETCHHGAESGPFAAEATLTARRAELAVVARAGHKRAVQSGLGRARLGPTLSTLELRQIEAWAAGEGVLGEASEAPPAWASRESSLRPDRRAALEAGRRELELHFESAVELVALAIVPAASDPDRAGRPGRSGATAPADAGAVELSLVIPGAAPLALGQARPRQPLALPAGLALSIPKGATLVLRRAAAGRPCAVVLQLATSAESRRSLMARSSAAAETARRCHGIALGPGQVLRRRGRSAAELGSSRRLIVPDAIARGALIADDSATPATLFLAAPAAPRKPEPKSDPKPDTRPRRRVF